MFKLKTILLILGWASVVSSFILFFITFFIAYFNGYEVLVTVNDYHEAHIEAIVYMISLPFALAIIWKSKDLVFENEEY